MEAGFWNICIDFGCNSRDFGYVMEIFGKVRQGKYICNCIGSVNRIIRGG